MKRKLNYILGSENVIFTKLTDSFFSSFCATGSQTKATCVTCMPCQASKGERLKKSIRTCLACQRATFQPFPLYFTRGHNKLRFFVCVWAGEADIYLWLSCVAKPTKSEKRQWQPSKQFGKEIVVAFLIFSRFICTFLRPFFPALLHRLRHVRWKFKLICIVWMSLLLRGVLFPALATLHTFFLPSIKT